MQTKSKKGFTLVEIMIVVVIIGLLAAMAIPAFQKVRATSQEKTLINNLRQLASGADQYFLEWGVTAVDSVELVGTESYIKVFNPVAKSGDNYTVNIQQGSPIEASHPDGRTISIDF
ncbi:prepilin-type N-terminal cleavage/methylation domain-containing protein [Coraliomargarita parva]|uniref:prepilin-type N-terminal cleavage/methylation domain-containing protein n=1 Tax=Coraliomargarita parva TaxID=3014050 RepID=UPI0022B5521C|nr:prepilin-type N-terminal cleavage/methylation domain-containing protein [Coraliomargarita parva]